MPMTSERNQQRLARLVAWADRHPVAGTALRIARELLAVDVRDRIFGMTGQAFLSLIPVTIIVSTFLSESDGESLANVVNNRLGLTGSTADTVLLLFSKPEPSPTTATASGLSLVLLLLSFNSYTRTIRRSMERPWGLPRVGWRGQLTGALGVFLLMLMVTTLSVVATVWHTDTRQSIALEATVRTVVAGVFWLGIGRLLTHRRVPSRHLWPGAVVGGIGTSAIALWTVTVLPGIFERDAARYGVIGVALALVTWLLAISGLAVVVGVVGGQIARAAGWAAIRPDPLVQPLLEQPERPGQEPDPDP
jgi:membrane protein